MKVISEAIYGFCCNTEESIEDITSFVVENLGLITNTDETSLIADVGKVIDYLRINKLLKCEYFMKGVPYLKANRKFSEALGYIDEGGV